MIEILSFEPVTITPLNSGIIRYGQRGILEIRCYQVSMQIKNSVALNRAALIQGWGAGRRFLRDTLDD